MRGFVKPKSPLTLDPTRHTFFLTQTEEDAKNVYMHHSMYDGDVSSSKPSDANPVPKETVQLYYINRLAHVPVEPF